MDTIFTIPGTTCVIQVEQVKKSKYKYTFKPNYSTEPYSITTNTEPMELQKNSKVGKEIWKSFNTINEIVDIARKYCDMERITSEDDIKEFKDKFFRYVKKELNGIIVEPEKDVRKTIEDDDVKEKYAKLYSRYENKKTENDYTDLQFLAQISQGVGVGVANIILKVYISYLLTLLKIKPTNVIAIGSQSSGKSFSIETALKMIPEEYIVKGVHTEAYFFGKFNGMNLDRYLFYLGDLGGVKDDEKTIVTRDILKQLNTDGYVERGIAPESEPREEFIEGNPAIIYSTVEETIINEQEKSRSSIVKPPIIDLNDLTLFNSFYDSPGNDYKEIEKIEQDVESVKGLTWYLMENINNYELFNPYMFSVSDFLRNMDDYNRKIKEFNKILLVVSLLNNPYEIEHQIYHNSEFQPVTTNLIIARKQDIINALEIFDGANNLLPTEKELLINLCGLFKPFDIDVVTENTTVAEYEKLVIDELVEEDGSLIDWDYETTDEKGNTYPIFFTVSDLKKINNKSIKDMRKTLSDRLRKFYENNYLIKIGHSNKGENIYGLVFNIKNRIENNIPIFKDDDIDRAKLEFKRKYYQFIDVYETFIEMDKKSPVKKVNYNTNEIELYNVPWG